MRRRDKVQSQCVNNGRTELDSPFHVEKLQRRKPYHFVHLVVIVSAIAVCILQLRLLAVITTTQHSSTAQSLSLSYMHVGLCIIIYVVKMKRNIYQHVQGLCSVALDLPLTKGSSEGFV